MATARPRPPVGEPAAGFEEHGLTWSDTPSRVTISLPMTKERLRALNLRVFTDGNNLTLTSSPATKGKEGTNVLVQVRLYGEVSECAPQPALRVRWQQRLAAFNKFLTCNLTVDVEEVTKAARQVEGLSSR